MTLEFILQYPRIVAAVFAAIFAGLIAGIACALMPGVPHPGIYITSAMFSAAFWMAIIGKRITNVDQSCTYSRAAILGAIATLLAILSVAILIDIEMRLENMIYGLASAQQTMRHLLVDDLASNLGGGMFALLFFGGYLVPFGGAAGMFLRWLRTLYELDERNELYEGNDRARLHTGDE